ncbi:hypothetical protein CY34DRAFT_107730 [Suillus luteus UH-Slu-Lm8-n1]|uniref:Uncharacterized protein n=1 Tax=Suillus luteus UH-Slu-Lm8-n1 TaxID=930992 RepID=A0A0D0BA89_9AGAM|nr:hypothetical protein CY34DRAFT_107730 [Suillus luteus UH-Slu-Lm8-n1]
MPSLESYAGVKELCENVLNMFDACFSQGDTPILKDARGYGTALIKFSRKHPKGMVELQSTDQGTERWRKFWKSWHDDTEYLSLKVVECQNSYENMRWKRDYLLHKEKLCTAMEMIVPDGVGWIWGATFAPRRDLETANMFRFITSHFIKAKNFNAAGDAFILFSGFSGHDHSPQDLIPFFQRGKLLHGALCVALRVARAALDNPAITWDSKFQDAVVKAICPQNGRDNKFTNANRLLNFPDWPEDGYSHLAGSPLSDIQCILLLVLPPPLFNNPTDYISFCSTLIFHLHSNKSKNSKLKPIALRRACQLGQDLAKIDAEMVNQQIRDIVPSKFFPALLEAVADSSDRNNYLRLIFAFASSRSWLPRLHKDDLIKWCIKISLELQKLKFPGPHSFYPFGILLRIQHAHPEQAAFGAIKSDQWWNIMKMAWHGASRGNLFQDVLKDVIESFGELVVFTEEYLPRKEEELQSFLECLGHARANTQLGEHILPRTGRMAKYEVDRLEYEDCDERSKLRFQVVLESTHPDAQIMITVHPEWSIKVDQSKTLHQQVLQDNRSPASAPVCSETPDSTRIPPVTSHMSDCAKRIAPRFKPFLSLGSKHRFAMKNILKRNDSTIVFSPTGAFQ